MCDFFCGKSKKCPGCPACPPKTVCPPEKVCPNRVETTCPPEKVCPTTLDCSFPKYAFSKEEALFAYRTKEVKKLQKELIESGLLTEANFSLLYQHLKEKFGFELENGPNSKDVILWRQLQDILHF